jgi:hypothetical protein
LIFEKSLSPMIMIDTHGTVMQYNECAVSQFGYSKDEVGVVLGSVSMLSWRLNLGANIL